jgi:hypothetical protein
MSNVKGCPLYKPLGLGQGFKCNVEPYFPRFETGCSFPFSVIGPEYAANEKNENYLL